MHEAWEELLAEEAVAEGLVAVDMRTDTFLAVVEVDGAKVPEADNVFESLHGGMVAAFGADVVSGGKGVAGVEAYSHAAFVVDAVDDAAEMFETPSEVGTLSGGVLDDGGDPLGKAQGVVDFAGYLVEAFFFADAVEVAARVEVQHGESQLLCPLHFVEECGTALL